MADACSAPPLRACSSTLVSPAVCFFVNGISYIAVVAALWAMRLKNDETPSPKSSPIEDLMEGVRYATGLRPDLVASPARRAG